MPLGPLLRNVVFIEALRDPRTFLQIIMQWYVYKFKLHTSLFKTERESIIDKAVILY